MTTPQRILLSLYLLPSLALAGTDIGAPTTGFFAQIGAVMQQFVNFLEGPFGLFVPIVGLSVAIGVWVLGTRSEGGMGWMGRVVMGSMLILNIPALIIALQAI